MDEIMLPNASNTFIVKLDHKDERASMIKELNAENLLIVEILSIPDTSVPNGLVKIVTSEEDNLKHALIYLSTNTYAGIAGLRTALARLFNYLASVKKDFSVNSIYVIMDEIESTIKAATVPTFEEFLVTFKRDSTNVYFEKRPFTAHEIFSRGMDYRISKDLDEDRKDKKKKKKGKK